MVLMRFREAAHMLLLRITVTDFALVYAGRVVSQTWCGSRAAFIIGEGLFSGCVG